MKAKELSGIEVKEEVVEVAVQEKQAKRKKETSQVVETNEPVIEVNKEVKEVETKVEEVVKEFKFIKPITGGVITSKYGMRNGKLHTGIDIADKLNTDIKSQFAFD